MLPKLVVFGSLNMDFVVQVDHLPGPGETVLGTHFQTISGGKGANQACAAGRLGKGSVAAFMIGLVGQDVFGPQLKASLVSAGVNVDFVAAHPGSPSGVALIWVDKSGQNSIVVASGANFAMTADDVAALRPAFEHSSYALFQLESPLPAVEGALGLARNLGVRTILDPAPARTLSPELLSQVDLLTPNESEACQLTGRAPQRVTEQLAAELARELRRQGCGAVVLKLGDQGCFYSSAEGEFAVPSFPVDAVDATAAGDVFNAALSVALAEQQQTRQALRFANAAAALSTTRVGAQSSVPSRSEVEAFLKSCAS